MFHVGSEVGRLRQVILHRPDLELKRLTPEQRAAAWRVFKLAVKEDGAMRREPERGKGASSQRGGSGKE